MRSDMLYYYAECCYADCHHTECCGATYQHLVLFHCVLFKRSGMFYYMLCDIMLIVIMLSVFTLIVVVPYISI